MIVSMLAHIGHLVHYGAGFDVPDGTEDWLTELFERLLAAVRRRATGNLLPGDVVEFVDENRRGKLPRQIDFVGTDGTADIGFASLQDDYTVSTVQTSEIGVVAGDLSRMLHYPSKAAQHGIAADECRRSAQAPPTGVHG